MVDPVHGWRVPAHDELVTKVFAPLLVAGGGLGLVAAVVLGLGASADAVHLVENGLPLGMLYATGVVAVVHRPDHPLARRLLLAGGLACVGLGICAVLDVLPAAARASGEGWMLNAVAILSLDVALAA